MINLKAELTKLGLSEQASATYMFLMKNGTCSASLIAESTKINRSSIYNILDELIGSGLITQFDDQGVTKYSAEAPVQIVGLTNEHLNHLEKQKALIQEFSEEAKTVNRERISKPFVKYHEGQKGYESLLNLSIQNPKNAYIYEITNHELCRKLFLKEINNYNKKAKNKNWFVRCISQGSTRVNHERLVNTPYNGTISSEIATFLDYVTFISLTENPKSFSIKHTDIATSMTSLFKLAI